MGDRLKELIEDTYRINHNRPVVVIAHSMGNPIFVNFINNQPRVINRINRINR